MRVPARIAAIRQETPTVRSFRLDLDGQEFHFKPGQWVDCYAAIEGRLKVAGFSITSSPLLQSSIELAVKKSENPVARYLHESARVGGLLQVDGGQGDFYYQRGMGDSLVLVAGGIGITPLMSILRYVDEAAPEVSATLLYSVKVPSELLFGQELRELSARNSRVRCIFTITQATDAPWDGLTGRFDLARLQAASLDIQALYFVCGPPGMVQHMLALLEKLGVHRSRIKHEQW